MKELFRLIQSLIDNVGLFNDMSVDIFTNEHEDGIEVIPDIQIHYLYEDGLEEALDDFLGTDIKDVCKDNIWYMYDRTNIHVILDRS